MIRVTWRVEYTSILFQLSIDISHQVRRTRETRIGCLSGLARDYSAHMYINTVDYLFLRN